MGHSKDWFARTHRQEERLPLRGAACVAEADEATSAELARALDRMGFATHEARSAAAARFIAAHVRLEVVVINLLLPDEHTLKFIRQLRRANPRLRIVSIAPGGWAATPLLELARIAGADAALQAPVGAAALCRAVSISPAPACSRPRSERALGHIHPA